jgi:hypothetical protein
VRPHLRSGRYCCIKAGGSLGPFDVIAVGHSDIRLIQVKAGQRPWLSPLEREAIELVAVPRNATKELWRFRDYARTPDIEVL